MLQKFSKGVVNNCHCCYLISVLYLYKLRLSFWFSFRGWSCENIVLYNEALLPGVYLCLTNTRGKKC